jgi:hypothetical protein
MQILGIILILVAILVNHIDSGMLVRFFGVVAGIVGIAILIKVKRNRRK